MNLGKVLEVQGHLVCDLRIKGQLALSLPDPNHQEIGEWCHMQLTLVSFLCDTWTLAPLRPLMGSSLCSPMGGDTTQAPLWPSLIPCNTSWCSQLLSRR